MLELPSQPYKCLSLTYYAYDMLLQVSKPHVLPGTKLCMLVENMGQTQVYVWL